LGGNRFRGLIGGLMVEIGNLGLSELSGTSTTYTMITDYYFNANHFTEIQEMYNDGTSLFGLWSIVCSFNSML
jgi:hypothetical protein